MIARGDREEGEIRFGKEGYKRLMKEINREILIYTLMVDLPMSLLITFLIWVVWK